jgi:Protein of unknown function (DUF1559)
MKPLGKRKEIICNGILVAALCFVLFLLIWPATVPLRDDCGVWVQTANDLKGIGLAFHNYHQDHGRFPLSAIFDKEGQPLLSWRVALLPYLEEAELYSQFHLDEPWDSSYNLPLLARIPHVYSGTPPHEPYGTYYQVFVGSGSAFEDRLPMTFKSFTDGTSQTILVIESGEAVPWTKPRDLHFFPDQPLPKLAGHSKKGFTYSLYADGSGRRVPNNLDQAVLRALITRNGGEKLGDDEHGNWCIRPEKN